MSIRPEWFVEEIWGWAFEGKDLVFQVPTLDPICQFGCESDWLLRVPAVLTHATLSVQLRMFGAIA